MYLVTDDTSEQMRFPDRGPAIKYASDLMLAGRKDVLIWALHLEPHIRWIAPGTVTNDEQP